MRRVLLALAVFLTATASPTFAGYIIIRVLLESSGGAAAPATPGGGMIGPAGPGILGGPGALGGRPGGSAGGPPGGALGPEAQPGPMGGSAGGTAAGPAGYIDHSRAVVAVIPLETDLMPGRLDMKHPFNQDTNPAFRRFVVPYHGRELKSALFVDSTTIHLYTELLDKPKPRQTRYTEMRDKYQAWLKGKSDPQLLYDALIMALQSGFIRDTSPRKDLSPPNDALTFAQELLSVAAENKLTLPDNAKRFVAAWEPMQTAVKGTPAQPSNAETWKIKLDARNVRVDGHYAILSWDSQDAEIARRAAQLNDNFAAYFLWHATRGSVIPVPDKPLVVVLAADARAQMGQLRVALDGLPIQADAFYAPDHNIVVLSPERMDDVGRTFLKQTQQIFSKGLNREELLAAKIPKIDATGQNGSRPEDVARANTLAVVEKLVVEESELAAVSREGTRQLMFSTGVLPKHVTLPNWLTQGAVNAFARPRGPAYVTVGDDDKQYMAVAFTTGYGVPNYVLHRYFREMGDEFHKELNPDPVKLLENVLTDSYFAGLKDGLDPDPASPVKRKKPTDVAVGPPGPGGPAGSTAGLGPKPGGSAGGPGAGSLGPPAPGGPSGPGAGSLGPPAGGSAGGPPGGITGGGPMGPTGVGQSTAVAVDPDEPIILQRKKRERLTTKAQATSWALYYYLSRARSEQLKLYVAELNKLPRDLPIDGRTAHAAFVRVFKLSSTEDGPADPALVRAFAKEWLDYMSTVPTVSFDIPLVVPEAPKPMTTAGPGAGSIGPGPGGKPGGGN